MFGEKNPILGQIVCANVRLREAEEPREFQKRLKAFCRERIEEFKVPVKVRVIDGALPGERFKKSRNDVQKLG